MFGNTKFLRIFEFSPAKFLDSKDFQVLLGFLWAIWKPMDYIALWISLSTTLWNPKCNEELLNEHIHMRKN